jgi:pyrroline-5-carboxylate reductase
LDKLKSMLQHRFGFIGAGRMATALARGFVESGLATAEGIVASDASPAAADEFHRATGARIAESNVRVVDESDVVFLAVKPQHMAQVLGELRGKLLSRHLVVSIAAGVPLAALATGLGAGPRLVRVMPNTPCLVGQGASAYCLGSGATSADGDLVGRLLSAVGRAHELDEKLMDAVTGLSGSGPAFVYLVIEALSDGGVQVGLPREVATALAAQTVRGAAELVLATGQHTSVLKDAVASPGGTTIAGLAALEAAGVRAALMSAVVAATRRAAELGATVKNSAN